MSTPFQYSSPAQKIVFGSGTLGQIADEVRGLGARRVLLVCGGNTRKGPIFEAARAALGDLAVAVFDKVVEHSATDLVQEGADLARDEGVDAFVAVGGGSASDTAKAIAILLAEGGRIQDHASHFVPPDQFFPKELHRPKLPVIAVPTTASAAEVTPGLGIKTPSGEKLLFWDVKLASRVIILDPRANLDVPVGIMASTAMNGFAHCAEGLYSRLRNPISEGIALQGARMFINGVPAMVADPGSEEHRGTVLSAAVLSGMVISNARVGIHHAICHCLGALGGLSHGVANAIMLPHALAYNVEVSAKELRRLGEAMGVDAAGKSDQWAAHAAIEAVRKLQRDAKVATRLRDTGLDRDKLPAIAERALSDRGLFFNPKRTELTEPILALLEAAW